MGCPTMLNIFSAMGCGAADLTMELLFMIVSTFQVELPVKGCHRVMVTEVRGEPCVISHKKWGV